LIHRRLRETGSFLPNTVNRGRNRNLRTPAIEEQVIGRVTENPRLNTRKITLEMQNVCSSTVWKILHEDLLYPYHIRVQALLSADYPSQIIFAQWYMQQRTFPNF
jgi:Transposase.